MEQNNVIKSIAVVTGLVIFISVMSVVVGALLNSSVFTGKFGSVSVSETFLVESSKTLDGSPFIITSKKLNRTWIKFDGINDFATITSNEEVISFWYSEDLLTWTFVVNNSGTLYTNASIGSPSLYPIYYDGSSYIFGKTNSTNFVNVSIDEVRLYNTQKTLEEIELLYILGR